VLKRLEASSGRARPLAKTRGGEANVGRILDAALAAFAAAGFSGARVEAIASAAGLSKTNLLYYFRTKDDLYLAVLRRMLDMWIEPLAAMNAHDDPRAALAAYIWRKLEYARDHPEASRLFAMEVMRGAPILNQVLTGDLKAMVDEKAQLLAHWMDEGRLRRQSPRHLLFMIWATTQHYADFATQVEALTGRTLADDGFFNEAAASLMSTFGLSDPALDRSDDRLRIEIGQDCAVPTEKP
jgi:TetR/AcrR family transcriptional regulator